MNKTLYWIISLTWGLLMTLIGAIVFSILILCGHKVQQNQLGWRIEIGDGWGGFSMGPFALVERDNSFLSAHEFGHSIQNCIFGPFMLIIVVIPSIARYWYYQIIRPDKDYYSIWFEAQANYFGFKGN